MNPLSPTVPEALTKLGDFSSSDVDWFVTTARQEKIASGTVVLQESQRVDQLSIVLTGTFTRQTEGGTGPQEIGQLTTGDAIGMVSLMNNQPAVTTITCIAPAQVLSLSYAQLQAKLKQDRAFAARFYRAVAVSLSSELRQISALLVRSRATAEPPLRKVLLVFAELTDNDVAWMLSMGQSIRAGSQQVLIQEGTPADALYILLEGTLSVFISATVNGATMSKEVAKLATGEIVGEMSFIDANPPSATVKSSGNSLVLALPRSALTEKLKQDSKFAARFYQAMAIVLADRLRDRLVQHGYSKLPYNQDQPLDEDAEYEDELDVDLLDNVALAGARFDWLIRQVRSRG